MSRLLGVCCCALLAGLLYRAAEPVDAMRAAAREFAASLSAEQRAEATFAFEDAERRDWHYVPRDRNGIPLGALSPEQRKLAWKLLRSALSERGVRAVDDVLVLEQVLREVESNSGRDPGKFYVSLFGDLAGTGRFGWRLEGHHISLNFAEVEGSQLFSFTPQFFGANPAIVRGGAHDGLRVLAREEDLGRALVKSLDQAQRKLAIVAGAAPEDVILGPSRTQPPSSAEGIRFVDLTQPQQEALWNLLSVYLARESDDTYSTTLTDRLAYRARAEEDESNVGVSVAMLEAARIEAQKPELRFVWAGGLEPGEPHYYRIQGPHFAIEYDNVQGGANHVHTLWRDFERDFGDPLRAHYEREHK